MTTQNTLKTVFLLAFLTGLLVLMGRVLGGAGGMVIALLFAIVMNFGMWWFSDSIALRMARAQEASESDFPNLHRLVAQLAVQARIPKPRVYVIPDQSPNAFATGRDPSHAAVAATVGILQLLTEDELAGVMAHELAHIKNRDTLIATVVAAMAGAISMIANMAQWALIFGGLSRGSDEEDNGGSFIGGLVAIIVIPIVATLVQFAISRAREFQADATGAQILGDPLALASALEKLEYGVARRPLAVDPAASHMFIVNPFTGSSLANLLSTHPPIAERVARLRLLASQPRSYGLTA